MSMPFAHSPRSTVGIEWELQLIDSDSLDLRQCAEAVLAEIHGPDGAHPSIHHELLLNTVEVVSAPARTVPEAVEDIEASMKDLGPIMAKLRLELATAGTHPFANPLYQRVTNKERYAKLVDRTRYWGQQMLLFGMHVHVGIEEPRKVIPILNALMTRHAHLQALSSSSPFWSNRDTGYASNRAMMFQQLPTAGIPHQFDDWAGLESYTADMLRTGVIDDFSEVRWDIRPSPKLGTIEVRTCDAPTNVTELKALAALTHCLVEHYSTELDEGRTLPRLPQWFVAENKWRSARYGMDAILILDAEGNEELVSVTVAHLLGRLEPVARRLGCVEELRMVEVILNEGASYQRQHRAYLEGGRSMEAVVRQLVTEMKLGRPS
ncbi:MAG: glutamate--cysteine ligase [Actinomycetes bacterium]|nr:glutamate--cysteine ligase [Actinomycetes bacterium]MDX5380987.1 glutamate--cysteine ligase [Actinomycetes bacterium]MDX5400123.1 glutamate--cysteine ligase [Actinomycetes bacterium]MDX5450745.1 glutamate--cysteine ligase [Actinomycetes bacterium]